MGGTATTHTTQTTHTSSSHSGMGGHEDPGKKSKDMQERYRYREDKLITYTALVDVLEIKGENVFELRKCVEGSKLTAEESDKGMKVFANVSAAMMSFDFMKIMQYSAELEEIERIDNEKERNFRKLEMLLKTYDKYEEIRKEFGIVTYTTTTTTTTHPVASGMTMTVTGLPTVTAHVTTPAPVPVPAPVHIEVKPGLGPAPVPVPVPAGTTTTYTMPPPPISATYSMPPPVVVQSTAVADLEKRVAALELSNAQLKKELDEFKTQQAAQNQSIDAWIKYLQSQSHTH